MGVRDNPRELSRRLLLSGAVGASFGLVVRRAVADTGARPPDAAHRLVIDVPILADDPVSIPITVSMEQSMEPDHYVRSIEVTLPTDPVPQKGLFRFTPLAGRASVAYQFRSGQGGELIVVGECSRHGRFEVRQPVRVAAGGCAVPPGPSFQERGGTPSVRVDARGRKAGIVPVWAALRHSSHTGLVERKGQLVRERAPYFVEQLATFRDGEPVNEFTLTPAVSPDPRVRFFVRAEGARELRVEFANNRGERWVAAERVA